MTASWNADTLFGVSDATGASAEVVIVGITSGGGGGGGGGGGCGDEGAPYSTSPGIAGFERRMAVDGSRTRGKSAMSSKRDAAASRLNADISRFDEQKGTAIPFD